jgi:6-phosphofructokinase 1
MRLLELGHDVIGITHGWQGLVDGTTMPLTSDTVKPIISEGGTILCSSRTNPFKSGHEELRDAVLANLERLGIDALIAMGGDDTLGVASKLYQSYHINVVGVPKTMDNDLSLTDYTFGFDSAANIAMENIDRLRDTAKSLQRIIVVEVMGRQAGWVALFSGVAAGADWVLLPEVPTDIDAMCRHLKAIWDRGQRWGLVVASEGAIIPGLEAQPTEFDEFGHELLKELAVGPTVADLIKTRTGLPTRDVVFGLIVRGGGPTLFDRILGTRVGIKAANLVHDRDFGKMVALQGTHVLGVPIKDAVDNLKVVPRVLYDTLSTTFQT